MEDGWMEWVGQNTANQQHTNQLAALSIKRYGKRSTFWLRQRTGESVCGGGGWWCDKRIGNRHLDWSVSVSAGEAIGGAGSL